LNLRFSAKGSTITVRTFAEGLLARFAHDLEIAIRDVTGEGTDEPTEATLRVALSGLRVAGVVRDGVVDERTLSASERADIEARMREALAGGQEIRVDASLAGDRATLVVRAPGGTQPVTVVVQVEREAAGVMRVRGECALSLRALGVPPVRGPAGAFRVADRVAVRFDARFEPS